MDWRSEMNHMLAVFDRQATASLNNIKIAFERNGLLLNAEFKQFFLDTSFDRIKLTYGQFEFDTTLARANFIADDAIDQKEPETQENSSDYQYGIDDIKVELNDVVLFDYDENNAEILETNSNGLNWQKYASPHTPQSHIRPKTVVAVKSEEIDVDDGEDRDIDTTNIPTSTVTSIDRPNHIDDTERNYEAFAMEYKMRQRSTTRSRAGKSNQLGMKKRFECEICEFSSKYSQNLNRHMYIHTGEKLYRCDICNKEFARIDHLKKHQVTHTEKIPFHCRFCFTGFPQEVEKDAHEKVCKRRRYECHICKKFTNVSKVHLKRHMRKHSGEKPFRCEICMMRFTQKSSMNAHLDNIHARNPNFLRSK